MLILQTWVTTRAGGVEGMTTPRISCVVWRSNVPLEDVDAEMAKSKSQVGPDSRYPQTYTFVFQDTDAQAFRKAMEATSLLTGVSYDPRKPRYS